MADCTSCGRAPVRAKLSGFVCKTQAYASQMWHKYKVTLEWYDNRLIELGNRCACCGHPPGPRGLYVDHNHDTGQVRDLVCELCNFMLGHAKDDPARLLAGVSYLGVH